MILNMPTNDSNTKVPDEHSSERAQQDHYTDAGEVIGDVQGYQEDNSYLYENPWALFTSGQGINLTSWFLKSKVPK